MLRLFAVCVNLRQQLFFVPILAYYPIFSIVYLISILHESNNMLICPCKYDSRKYVETIDTIDIKIEIGIKQLSVHEYQLYIQREK